jgi:hypothetical protein
MCRDVNLVQQHLIQLCFYILQLEGSKVRNETDIQTFRLLSLEFIELVCHLFPINI